VEFSVKWDGNMTFSGVTPSGHNMKMDAAETVGGENGGAANGSLTKCRGWMYRNGHYFYSAKNAYATQ